MKWFLVWSVSIPGVKFRYVLTPDKEKSLAAEKEK